MKPFLFILLVTTCSCMHFSIAKDYSKWDWNTLLNELSQAFKYYHLEDLLPSLDLKSVKLTKNCRDDLSYLTDSILDLLREVDMMIGGNKTDISQACLELALPMLDSSSKIGPGVLRGHIHFLGFLPQCIKVKHFVEKFDREIRGGYFRVYLGSPYFGNITCVESYDCPSLDLCLPHSCENDDLTPLFKSIRLGRWKNKIKKAEHINANITPPCIGTYITLTCFIILILLCFSSSVLDSLCLLGRGNECSKLLLAFAFHKNIKDIFTVSISEEDHIPVLHCMRFLSIAWVISAHTYGYLSLLVKNPLDQLETVHNGYWTAFYANGFPAVDSFFYMSGLLLSYIWFKEFQKNCSETMSLKAWLFFYIHRFIRLSPAYYLTLMFYTFVFSTWYTDMPVLSLSEIQNDTCRDQWWINILYLNNFISQDKMCFVVSWYLAVDIQLFLFSPLVLIPFAFSGYIGGLTAASALITVSIGITIYQVYNWSFPPLLYRLDDKYKEINNDYQFWMYYQPYIRCQPYVVGIVVGYFLQFTKTFNIHKVLNGAMYTLSFCTFFIVVFGVSGFLNGDTMSIFESALYNALAKLAWSLALAWITISCYYDHGGAVQSFMSWWIWIPLARLSFCAYLIHIPLIFFVWGMDKSEKIYSGELDTFVNGILPAIFYSFGMGILWKALLEMPFSKLEIVFLQRWRRCTPDTDGTFLTKIHLNVANHDVSSEGQRTVSTNKTY